MLEIEQMVIGVQRRFAEDLGWSLSPPMAFSLDTYIADLEHAEHAYKSQFGPLAVLTTEKWRLMERFFDTVVSKSREIFADSGTRHRSLGQVAVAADRDPGARAAQSAQEAR